MNELDRRNLGITYNGMIHIDNFTRTDSGAFKTWCGIKPPKTYDLDKYHFCYNIKLCKMCNKVYYKKYKKPFSSYIVVLKLKDKLFI